MTVMPSKRPTRAELVARLEPREGQEPSEVAKLTVSALEALLREIDAGAQSSEHSLHYAATAIGYLLADCHEEAARAARQAVSPVALASTVQTRATAADLLEALRLIRSRRKSKSPPLQPI